MSTHPGLNRLSRDEVCDKYLTLYDTHEGLKKTARLQEERIKRLATKVLRLADDKKKLQKVSSTGGKSNQSVTDLETDHLSDELNEKNEKLESENRHLIKKLEESKQLYVELLNKNKIVTSRVDSGLYPSAGPNRDIIPKRNSSLRANTSLRKIESSPKASRSNNIDLNHHLVAAQQENQNMLEAITLLQRKLAESQAEKHQLKTQLVHKDDMLNYTTENKQLQSTDMMTEISKIRQNLNKTEQTNQSLIMQLDAQRSKSTLLQQQMNAANIAHKTALSELENAQIMVTGEMEKVAKLQADRRTLLTLREEVQIEREGRKDSEAERDMLKQQFERIVRAETVGENMWKERETQFQRQIQLMEESIGSDAKEAQRLRMDLHQERMVNKRLSLKLDELENSLSTYQTPILNPIDLNHQRKQISVDQKASDSLTITTENTGNTNKDLEIALRQSSRRVKELEEKLITIHNQFKAKDVALKAIQSEYEITRSNLLTTVDVQSKIIDKQNQKIGTLQGNLKQIGIDGHVPDYPDLTSSKLLLQESSKTVPLGENIIVLHLRETELFKTTSTSNAISFFSLVEFANFKPISTNVTSGLISDLQFKHSYPVEVTNDFLSFLSDGHISIEIFTVIAGTQHSFLGHGKIELRQFLDRQQFRGRIEIVSNLVQSVGSIEFELLAQIPFQNAANLHKEKMTASGFIDDKEGPVPENELEIQIMSGQELESQFEDEEPSCSVTYSFYTYDMTSTRTIENTSAPDFGFKVNHRVEENENLNKYLISENITFVVLDAKDNGDDAEDFLGKCDIPLINLCNNKRISGRFSLVDPEGEESGYLEIDIGWVQPYKIRHRPLAPVPVARAEIFEEVSQPQAPPRSKKNSKQLLDSYVEKNRPETPPVIIHEQEFTETLEEEIVDEIVPVVIEEETLPEINLDEPEVINEAEIKDLDNTSETIPEVEGEYEEILEPETNDDEVLSISESVRTATSNQTNTSMRFTAKISGESENESIITPRSDLSNSARGQIKPIVINIKQLDAVNGEGENDAKKVFIEYDFFGVFCETNESLPFPSTEPTYFGFNQKFVIKAGSGLYDQLYSMLLPHKDVSSIVTFTLAVDPGDTDDQDCEDLAVVQIDLKQFLKEDDFQDKQLEMISDGKVIALLTMDISAKEAITSIFNDITA